MADKAADRARRPSAERTARRPVRRSEARPAPSRPAREPGVASALELDRVIHERLRLGIVSALATAPALTFNDLKHLLDATDGNLSVHARKLEDAGYVECSKGFDGRVPRTEYHLTSAGRRALERYLAHMEALIAAARRG